CEGSRLVDGNRGANDQWPAAGVDPVVGADVPTGTAECQVRARVLDPYLVDRVGRIDVEAPVDHPPEARWLHDPTARAGEHRHGSVTGERDHEGRVPAFASRQGH